MFPLEWNYVLHTIATVDKISGTLTRLISTLKHYQSIKITHSTAFPDSPRRLSIHALQNLAGNLHQFSEHMHFYITNCGTLHKWQPCKPEKCKGTYPQSPDMIIRVVARTASTNKQPEACTVAQAITPKKQHLATKVLHLVYSELQSCIFYAEFANDWVQWCSTG